MKHRLGFATYCTCKKNKEVPHLLSRYSHPPLDDFNTMSFIYLCPCNLHNNPIHNVLCNPICNPLRESDPQSDPKIRSAKQSAIRSECNPQVIRSNPGSDVFQIRKFGCGSDSDRDDFFRIGFGYKSNPIRRSDKKSYLNLRRCATKNLVFTNCIADMHHRGPGTVPLDSPHHAAPITEFWSRSTTLNLPRCAAKNLVF